MLELRTASGDRALVSPEGAQVLSWHARGREQLYCSPLAQPAPGRALRGGVPVCFPQFSGRGPLQKHGFARVHRWEVAEASADAALLRFDPALAPAAWPHAFTLALFVRLGEGCLDLELACTNEGTSPFGFTAALHTYFSVPDVRQVRIAGLQGSWYEDALDADRVKHEEGAALTFAGELDRVYRQAPASVELQAPGIPHRHITQAGFVDTVVWNPGPAKAATLGDMPPEDWLRMVCVEAAVAAAPILLLPGQGWKGSQRISVSPD